MLQSPHYLLPLCLALQSLGQPSTEMFLDLILEACLLEYACEGLLGLVFLDHVWVLSLVCNMG